MDFHKFNKTATKGKGGKQKPPAGRVLEHNCREAGDRERGNEKIDPERTHLNYDLAVKLRGGKSAKQLYDEFVEIACAVYEEKHGKAMRKDTVTLCSWVVTAPKDLPTEKYDEFFKETFDFLCARYGVKNVIAANVHLDETTPHLHFSFMPFVDDDEFGGEKLCAKGLETPKGLSKIHKDMQVYLSEKLDCEVNILNGTTVGGNKAIHELKMQTLQKETEAMERKLSDIQQQITDVQNRLILESQIPPRPVKPEPPELVKKRISGTREELKENARELKQYEKALKHYETKIIPAYEKELAAWENKYLSVENAQRLATELESEKRRVSAVSVQQTETEKNQNAKAAQQAKIEKEQASERQRLLDKEQALDGRAKQLEATSAARARYEAEQLLKRQGYVPKTNGHKQALKFNERNSNYEHSNNKNRTDFNFSK